MPTINNRSSLPGRALAFLAAALAAACGSSSGVNGGSGADAVPGGTAPISAASGCELAVYPSLQWTQCEAQNVLVGQENQVRDAALLPQLAAVTAAYQAMRLQLALSDPGRQPNPNTCSTVVLCPIDPRLQNWAATGGTVAPVLYTSRSGATMSGHVWATSSGPARRPGIVIINGSIVGYEQIYWYAAQALAKAGFVVMTFDAQGEGMSDQFGEAPDQTEDAFAGDPALGILGPTPATGVGLGGNGLPFYDGGADALDFFLSTPANPYVPVPSRTSGTSHNAKQQSRVAAGLDSAYNPYWQMIDTGSIGLAGHSYGAVAASWLAQQDARVATAVAWDSLCVPTWPSPDELAAFTGAPVNQVGGALPAPLVYGFAPECFAAPAPPAPRIAKPALGINADYLVLPLTPAPYLAPPGQLDKSQSSISYSQAGVNSGNIVIRGGSHYEYDDAPVGVFPSSLRGIDLVTWYTVAWFAKYLQHNPKADAMLLTARWRDDAATGAADPGKDPNLYSWHFKSRLDITLANGQRYDCENLRNGCAGQYQASEDFGPANYSFVAIDTAAEAAP